MAPPSLNLLSNTRSSNKNVSSCCAIYLQTIEKSLLAKFFWSWCSLVAKTSKIGQADGVKDRLLISFINGIADHLKIDKIGLNYVAFQVKSMKF